MRAAACCAGGSRAGRARSTPASRRVEIVDGDASVRIACSFADGSELDTDLVVFSAGIRPRDELARAAGPRRWASAAASSIDEACRTSDPDILAIGECALWNGKIYRPGRPRLPDGERRRRRS